MDTTKELAKTQSNVNERRNKKIKKKSAQDKPPIKMRTSNLQEEPPPKRTAKKTGNYSFSTHIFLINSYSEGKLGDKEEMPGESIQAPNHIIESPAPLEAEKLLEFLKNNSKSFAELQQLKQTSRRRMEVDEYFKREQNKSKEKGYNR
jgi:hypothetical protein